MREWWGLQWYNLMVPYKNWRIRKMWRDDPARPSHCPQVGRIRWDALQRMKKTIRERGLDNAVGH